MSRSLQFLVLLVLVCFATAIHIRDWAKATGDIAVSAWAKDNTYFYFGSALGITRVKTIDYQRDLTLHLNNNEAMVHAICLGANYGYAIVNSTTGAQLTVVQFNLGSATNFSRTASLNLFSVEFGQLGGICNFDASNNNLFIGITHTTLPAQIVQVAVAPFSLTRVGAISLQENEVQVNTVCVDTAANVAYYGLNSNRVAAISMGTFQRSTASATLNITATGVATGVTACAYETTSGNLFFGFQNGFLMRVPKTNLASQNGNVPQVLFGMAITGLAIDGTTNIYGTGKTATQGIIFKVDVASMLSITTAVLADGAAAPLPVGNPLISSGTGPTVRLSVPHSGTNLVGKMWTYDNLLVRVNATLSTIELNHALTSINSAPVDDGAGHFWIATSTPSAIVKVRKADWTQIQRCSLNPGDGNAVSILLDSTSIMVGTSTGNIVRFDLNCVRITWNPLNVLGANRPCTWLFQDSTAVGGNVYCIASTHTAIARINKNDVSMQVTRVNFLNEGVAQAAAIDSTNQIIYIMTANAPYPVLVKIRLADFVRVSVPLGLFNDPVVPMVAAGAVQVDAAGNIYVMSTGANRFVRVFKYSPTFTLLNNGTYADSQFNDINGYSMILSGTTLYITSAQGGSVASKLIRIDATNLNRIDQLSLTMPQTGLRFFATQIAAAALPVIGTNTLTLVGREAVPVLFSVALCADGQFYNEATGTCSCCPAGQYLPRESDQCLTCPQGYTCPSTCTSVPTGCPAGSYCPQGSISSIACATGFTSPALAFNCTICPAGSYCTNTTLITPCPAGTYQNFTGQTSVSACTACPAGTYSGVTGATTPVTCVYCPVGHYSTVAAATTSAVCKPCYPGSTNDPTRTFCTPCTPGYANENSGAACSPCAIGTYSNSFGALKCVACPAGQFNPNTTATYCQLCLPGTAQANPGQSSCVDCAAGTYSNIAGAINCLQCLTGTYQNATKQTSCLPCPPGYSSGQGTGVVAQEYCGACPPGTFSNSVVGTNQCFPCPTGTYNAHYNATSCQACPAGYFPTSMSTGIQNDGHTTCQPCSPGSYKTVASSGDACTACPAGFYQPNAAASSCIKCPEGTSSAGNAAACTICSPGTYSSYDNTVGTCMPCPDGHVAGYGASQCTKCASGFTHDAAKATCIACAPGTYGRDGVCSTCPVGTYNPLPGQTSCTRCPAGTSQSGTGALTCSACGLGTYSPSSGAVSCLPCKQGTYAMGQFNLGTFQVGATQCSLCPAGWSSSPGSSVCTPCPTGRYAANPGSAICEACPAGTVTPYVQQTSCEACPAGSTVTNAGQTACSFCAVDTFTDASGLPSCKNCPVGTFTNVSLGATSCMSCGDGEVVTSPSGFSVRQCGKCGPGLYLPAGVKSTTCFSCPAGTYSVGYGNTACTPCPAGTFSSASAANNPGQCAKCPIGQYSSAGSSACRACPYGSFSFPASQPGATSCKFCPPGHFSNVNDGNAGEALCLPCPAGTYSAREGAHNIINTTANGYNVRDSLSTQDSCLPCPVGTFAATAGSAQCLPCPQSTYADSLGSAQCKACPGNTFNTQFGSTHFNNCSSSCPVGYTNYAQNTTGISKSDSCVACPAGTFWLSYSSPCQPCPSGTYNPKVAQTQCFDCANSTAIGSSVCCKSVTNGNSTSIQCSSASFSKMFNPMFILAAILLALSAML